MCLCEYIFQKSKPIYQVSGQICFCVLANVKNVIFIFKIPKWHISQKAFLLHFVIWPD